MKKIKVLLVLGMIAVFAAISCSKNSENPEATIDKMIKAAQSKDWDIVYDCFSKESTAKLETMMKSFIQLTTQMAKMNPEASKELKMDQLLELEKSTGKDFFIKAYSMNDDMTKQMIAEFENYTVTKKEITGNKANLTIKTAQKEDEVEFIKEGGMWKMDLTGKLNQAAQQGK